MSKSWFDAKVWVLIIELETATVRIVRFLGVLCALSFLEGMGSVKSRSLREEHEDACWNEGGFAFACVGARFKGCCGDDSEARVYSFRGSTEGC